MHPYCCKCVKYLIVLNRLWTYVVISRGLAELIQGREDSLCLFFVLPSPATTTVDGEMRQAQITPPFGAGIATLYSHRRVVPTRRRAWAGVVFPTVRGGPRMCHRPSPPAHVPCTTWVLFVRMDPWVVVAQNSPSNSFHQVPIFWDIMSDR
jgi:hypothetical protein